MVAGGEQRGDEADAVWRDVVAAGPAGFGDELLAAEFAGRRWPAGWCSRPARVLGDGEPARCRSEGERCGQRGPDPRLVQVDPGDPAGPGLDGQGQLIEQAVSRLRRQRSSLALCTVASKRSRCPPLV
jgi:hypothetical protein